MVVFGNHENGGLGSDCPRLWLLLLLFAGDGSKQVSVQEYLGMAGMGGGKQYGK